MQLIFHFMDPKQQWHQPIYGLNIEKCLLREGREACVLWGCFAEVPTISFLGVQHGAADGTLPFHPWQNYWVAPELFVQLIQLILWECKCQISQSKLNASLCSCFLQAEDSLKPRGSKKPSNPAVTNRWFVRSNRLDSNPFIHPTLVPIPSF